MRNVSPNSINGVGIVIISGSYGDAKNFENWYRHQKSRVSTVISTGQILIHWDMVQSDFFITNQWGE